MDIPHKKAEISAKDKGTVRLTAKLAKGALYALGGYTVGICSLPFGAIPFGFALLAGADANAPLIYLGLALSCFFSGNTQRSIPHSLLLLGVYSALLLLRVLVRLTVDSPFPRGEKQSLGDIRAVLFSEHPCYRVLQAAISTFSVCLFILIGGGFLYYDLIGLLLSVAAAPAAAYAFYCFFEKDGLPADIGFFILAAVLSFSSAPFAVYGVSLSLLGGLLLTCYLTEMRGLAFGCITAAACGLAYSPKLSPVFLLTALAVGTLGRFSIPLAMTVSLASGLSIGFAMLGLGALDGVVGGVIAACLIYASLSKLFSKKAEVSTAGTKDETVQKSKAKAKTAETVKRCTVARASDLDSVKLAEINRRTDHIDRGIERLAEYFDELRRHSLSSSELSHICGEAFLSSCYGCAEYASCFGSEEMKRATEEFTATLREGKPLSAASLQGELVGRCQRISDILDEINYNSGIRSAFSGEEADMELLRQAMMSRSCPPVDDFAVDSELSEKLCRGLSGKVDENLRVLVYGRRSKTVYIKVGKKELPEGFADKIIDIACDSISFRPDRSKIFHGRTAGGSVLIIPSRARLGVDISARQTCAEEKASGGNFRGGNTCGDSTACFFNNDGYFFALISDGMGNGRQAAAVSRLCTELAKNILTVGECDLSVPSVIGDYLSRRCIEGGYECSATVDLMQFDPSNGEASFFKSGAAASYVYRDGGLFKLRCCNMPIGILGEAESKRFDLRLSPGDVVIMMSDGVTDGNADGSAGGSIYSKDECPWLFDLLRQTAQSASTDRIAELTVKYAKNHGSKDDITVVAMRVREK